MDSSRSSAVIPVEPLLPFQQRRYFQSARCAHRDWSGKIRQLICAEDEGFKLQGPQNVLGRLQLKVHEHEIVHKAQALRSTESGPQSDTLRLDPDTHHQAQVVDRQSSTK